MKRNNPKCSQHYAEFQVITADLDRNPLASRNALRIGLSEAIKDSFMYSIMPQQLPTFVMVCQKQNNQIQQWRAEKAAHNRGGGTGFASSPKPPAPPRDPTAAPAGTVAGYTGPAPMDLSAGSRWISAEQRATRFMDERSSYSGGFNPRAAECTATKKAPTFRAAAEEIHELGTGAGSGESGKD